MNTVVRTKDLIKTYTADGIETPALRGVSLEIQAGEFTALAGPSGSGKSTLLHLIGGLLLPTSGEVWIEDQLLSELTPDQRAQLRLRRVGFVFQAYNLIPVLTARENAEFVLELQNVAPDQRRARAIDVLKDLDMDTLADRPPNKLSGGQQQRVAVARAVAAQPALVLADEPTANLDSQNSRNLMELLRKLNRQRGTTFLFASHDPEILSSVDRVIELHDGKISSDSIKNKASSTPSPRPSPTSGRGGSS